MQILFISLYVSILYYILYSILYILCDYMFHYYILHLHFYLLFFFSINFSTTRTRNTKRWDGIGSVLCHGFSYKKKEKTAKLRDEFYFGPPAATPLKYNSLKSRKRGDSSSQGSRLKTSLNVPFFSL